ncbi:hypothetical protein [Actinocorallia populi]|uniref:hypothetical protein n=1 Tax=Actinocorallia populi TaxID=2079200 RepID=UPI000D08EF82|nr:hypothetical protein [Actinocorallia populi]
MEGRSGARFISRMNSPTRIDGVKGLTKARGGRADRVGRLSTGEFYAAGVGLTEAGVLQRARL